MIHLLQRKPALALIATVSTLCAGGAIAGAYSYATIDFPGAAGYTTLGQINDSGESAGIYVDALGGIHGYTDIGGVFTSVDAPLAQPGQTAIYGLGNAGVLSGAYVDGAGNQHGVVDAGGSFTTIDHPLATTYTSVTGDNTSGLIVGTYGDAAGDHGFTDIGGVFTTFNDPSAAPGATAVHGVTDTGMIYGGYYDAAHGTHGFIDVGGVFTTIGGPVRGAANDGALVGGFVDHGVEHGYLDGGGVFTTLTDPHAAGFTLATGVNDAGQIVGEYADSSGHMHGFLATPPPAPVPEPASWAMMLVGPGVLGAAFRRRRGALAGAGAKA